MLIRTFESTRRHKPAMTPPSCDKVTSDPVYPRPLPPNSQTPATIGTSQCTAAGIRFRLNRFGVHFTISECISPMNVSRCIVNHKNGAQTSCYYVASGADLLQMQQQFNDDNLSCDLNESLRHTLHCFNRRFYNYILICNLNNFTQWYL